MMSANIPKSTRKAVYRRDGYRCALCDSTRYLQVHHVVPRGKGGTNAPENLITLCADCHALAHGIDLRDCGIPKQEIEQSITEYMADLYAENGTVWTPDY